MHKLLTIILVAAPLVLGSIAAAEAGTQGFTHLVSAQGQKVTDANDPPPPPPPPPPRTITSSGPGAPSGSVATR